MRKILSLSMILFGVQASLGQIRPVSSGPDIDNLYNRLTDSLYVIKGRVLDSKGIGRRPAKNLNPVSGIVTGSTTETGTLFTVSVEEVICQQGDFSAIPSDAPSAPPSIVHFFVPRDEPQGVPSRFNRYLRLNSEYLMRDREYLLFVRKEPKKEEELISTYQLEPGFTYYRTYEGNRGAVELPDGAHPEGPYSFIAPLVSTVTAFCGAVKAPDVETKIRNLNGLRNSASPVLRLSVDAAINALRGAPAQPPQKQ